jgi:hypothetical protein
MSLLCIKYFFLFIKKKRMRRVIKPSATHKNIKKQKVLFDWGNVADQSMRNSYAIYLLGEGYNSDSCDSIIMGIKSFGVDPEYSEDGRSVIELLIEKCPSMLKQIDIGPYITTNLILKTNGQILNVFDDIEAPSPVVLLREVVQRIKTKDKTVRQMIENVLDRSLSRQDDLCEPDNQRQTFFDYLRRLSLLDWDLFMMVANKVKDSIGKCGKLDYAKMYDEMVTIIELMQTSNECLKDLPINELQALSKYTGDAYTEINAFLRNGDDDETVEDVTKTEETVKHLKSVLNKCSVLSSSVTLYRGVTTDAFLKGLRPGDVFTDPAFLSTSIQHPSDTIITPFVGRDCCLMVIRVPRGTPALWLGTTSERHEEREVLLLPDLKLVLLRPPYMSHYETGNREVLTYEFEVV